RPHHIAGEMAVDRKRDRLRDPVVRRAVRADVAGLAGAVRRRPLADLERLGDARDQPTRLDLAGRGVALAVAVQVERDRRLERRSGRGRAAAVPLAALAGEA